MSEEYKFDRNYLKLLIDNKDKLIEVPINDVKLILTYCEILLDRQSKTIELTKNLLETEDKGYYQIIFKEILKCLGDKENDNNRE